LTNSIVFDQVNKKYPLAKVVAVHDFSLQIQTGEFFCLIGPSGCGKSTVLKLIAGLETPTSGKLDRPTGVSMVFQSGALFPWLTVEENVAFGLRMKKIPESLVKESVTKYLAMVNLSEFAHHYPRELSGGQRQRVGIARALAVIPDVLLLDEPFSALDSLTTTELHADLLKIWNDTKITIVMVSHLLEEAVLLADRVGVMKEGTLKGTVEIYLDRPRNYQDKDFQEVVAKLHRLM